MTVQENAKPVKRRKNRGAGVGVTTRADVMKYPCHYCGEKAQSIDHLIPWSQGGTNQRSNLVGACWICNGMKGAGTQEDLIAFCMDLETAVTYKKSKRHLIWFSTIKAHAPKILAWHAQKAKQLPVV